MPPKKQESEPDTRISVETLANKNMLWLLSVMCPECQYPQNIVGDFVPQAARIIREILGSLLLRPKQLISMETLTQRMTEFLRRLILLYLEPLRTAPQTRPLRTAPQTRPAAMHWTKFFAEVEADLNDAGTVNFSEMKLSYLRKALTDLISLFHGETNYIHTFVHTVVKHVQHVTGILPFAFIFSSVVLQFHKFKAANKTPREIVVELERHVRRNPRFVIELIERGADISTVQTLIALARIHVKCDKINMLTNTTIGEAVQSFRLILGKEMAVFAMTTLCELVNYQNDQIIMRHAGLHLLFRQYIWNKIRENLSNRVYRKRLELQLCARDYNQLLKVFDNKLASSLISVDTNTARPICSRTLLSLARIILNIEHLWRTVVVTNAHTANGESCEEIRLRTAHCAQAAQTRPCVQAAQTRHVISGSVHVQHGESSVTEDESTSPERSAPSKLPARSVAARVVSAVIWAGVREAVMAMQPSVVGESAAPPAGACLIIKLQDHVFRMHYAFFFSPRCNPLWTISQSEICRIIIRHLDQASE